METHMLEPRASLPARAGDDKGMPKLCICLYILPSYRGAPTQEQPLRSSSCRVAHLDFFSTSPIDITLQLRRPFCLTSNTSTG